jgi:hypothetical protein
MTATEPTPDYEENVTDGIDYEQLGRETAAVELEASAYRVRYELKRASEKVESDDLEAADIEKAMKELASARVWLARVAEGRHVEAHEVLD